MTTNQTDRVVKVTKVTVEEAQAFRDRVKRQNEEISKMVVFDIDEVLELLTGEHYKLT